MKNISVQIVFVDYDGDELPFAVYVNGELEKEGLDMTGTDILGVFYKYEECLFGVSEYFIVGLEYDFPKHFEDIPNNIIKKRSDK